MGGAPPLPLDFAPQGSKKAFFFAFFRAQNDRFLGRFFGQKSGFSGPGDRGSWSFTRVPPGGPGDDPGLTPAFVKTARSIDGRHLGFRQLWGGYPALEQAAADFSRSENHCKLRKAC